MGRGIWTVSHSPVYDGYPFIWVFADLIYVLQGSLRQHLRSQMRRTKSRIEKDFEVMVLLASVGLILPFSGSNMPRCKKAH